MDDGREIVAKIPNPNARREFFTTASEVATMDFMRNILKTPVPRVLAWSPQADNPVKKEYILMGKAPGVQLKEIWNRLDMEGRLHVIKKIADQDLVSAPSLVYTNKEGKGVVNERFAVGPSTSRQNTDDGRMEIEFDRGPWDIAEEYELATGLRELACVRESPQLPKSPIALYGPGTYRPSKEKKIQAIQECLKIVKYLLPNNNSTQRSHIWHDDLHLENIFVNPDDPSDILAIIDWQSTELAPLYDRTIEPYILEYDGPPLESLLERPKFEDVRKLFAEDADSQRKAISLYLKMNLVALYRFLVYKTNKQLFRAIEYRETDSFQLLLFARNLFVDGEATYLALLVELQRKWADLPGVQASHNPECPIQFSDDEVATIEADCEGAALGINLMRDAQERLDSQFSQEQGLIEDDKLDEARRELREIKQDLIQEYATNEAEEKVWEEAWPFDD
ncbi:phosphotransferase family protein [Paecilomyces variotii No. 5]|uniref:Phosphotransferase family protein n=1 Tax=Byssochlamys spectabilis (strain No. 5 / NBRC 109023) TaxID=1356009 RepID=V5G705_BYSSN|nr:phosphotransferase family protein [Paecilomyces variotii No. 5]